VERPNDSDRNEEEGGNNGSNDGGGIQDTSWLPVPSRHRYSSPRDDADSHPWLSLGK